MAVERARAALRGGVAACAVAALAAAAAPGGTAAAQKAFGPGAWSGRGVQSGKFELRGNRSPLAGTVTFQLRIAKKSLAATGTVHIQATMTTETSGLRGKVMVVGTLPLSGTGRAVAYAGHVGLNGTLTDGNATVPFKRTLPVSGKLLIAKAGCSRVVGTTDARIPFTWSAVRSGGSGCH
jgi:hypothetical protein